MTRSTVEQGTLVQMTIRSVRSGAALVAVGLGALLLGPRGPAAQAFTSARVVKPEAYVSLDKVPPGSPFRLAVAARIGEGFHVNAHKPSFDYLIATDLQFAPGDAAGFTLGEPIYPPPVERSFAFTDGKTLRVYEGTALIGVEATASRDLKPGARTLHATLTAQACNDNSCLA